MNDFREIKELELQRASILSNQRFSQKERDEITPRDKYNLVHVIFFFFGLGSFLSLPFFLTANDYWMYKFRDVSQATYDSSNKTDMQRYFASATSITHSIPGLITTILTALYGHKVHIKSRILYTLFVLASMYFVFTAFIKVNTDEWQTVFFYTTLAGYVVITVSTNVFNTVMFNLISRFPPQYMKTQMYGQGAAGIFSALLQVISLAVVDDTISSALIYFLCGTAVLVVTFLMGVLSLRLEFFRYYLGDTVADTKRAVFSMEEIKEAAKRTWPCLFIFISTMATIGTGHPNITSLIISENYGSGSAWSDKYFVPVATYLSHELYNLAGRYLGVGILTKKNALVFVAIHLARLIVVTPIYMFCNAEPRHHLPVLFPHDWEYLVIIAVAGLSGSFLLTCVMLSMPNLAGDKTEVSFLLMMSIGSVVGVVNSFLSTLYVGLL